MSTSRPTPNTLRTVFDSNIYIAAALRPGQHADRWLDIAMLPQSGLELYVSPQILAEVRRKLVDRFGFISGNVDRLIERIRASATVVEPKFRIMVVLMITMITGLSNVQSSLALT